MTFKVGDRVVLDSTSHRNNGLNPGGLSYGETYVVTKLQQNLVDPEVFVRCERTGSQPKGSFYALRFKAAPAAAEPRAMTIEVAREQRKRLAEALGLPEKEFRIRSRSWDTEGLYFAVERGAQKFYKPSEVTEHIAKLAPIDVGASRTSGYYTFTVDGEYILAPDNSRYWTISEIRECGGTVTHKGRRYRLGETKGFVPFV